MSVKFVGIEAVIFANFFNHILFHVLLSEPLLESIPQIHIILLIVFAGSEHTVDRTHWKTIATFAFSVFSAAYGMSRFFSVGPCRLV